ncbi:hypothetical protein AGMB00912_01839 [Lactiplantibacillus argentoratensis]
MTDEQAHLFSDDVGRGPVTHFIVGKVATVFLAVPIVFIKFYWSK